MDIKIKDFGPIAEGDISLAPLTIFIGSNNTGKSYAATLAYSLYSSLNRLVRRVGRGRLYGRKMSNLTRDPISLPLFEDKKIIDFANIVKSKLISNKEVNITIPEEIVNDTFLFVLRSFNKILEEEISRSFASDIIDIIRIDKRALSFTVNINGLKMAFKCRQNQLILDEKLLKKEIPKLPVHFKIMRKKTSGDMIIGGEHWRFEMPIRFLKKMSARMLANEVIKEILVERVIEYISPSVKSCYYLPAARSGILQGHRVLSMALMERAPLAGLRKIEIPTLSGITSDFIMSLLNLPPRRFIKEFKEIDKIVKSLEKDIKGEIQLDYKTKHTPEIIYTIGKHPIPLHRTSSMISELAPLFLYLKYLIDSNSLLIFEEPESHLHPGMQRKIARVITLLIRNGVKVLMTTHSDYLIEQINNFIKMYSLKKKERESMRYTGQEFLKPDELSVYLFKYSDEHKGTVTERLEVSKEGIPQEEFGRIAESLYEEKVKLERKITD